MNKFSWLSAVLCAFPAAAQLPHFCGTDQMQQQWLEKHPTMIIEHEKLEAFIQNWLQHNAHTRDENVYVIPVVFHIIHDYGSENISDEQVRDAVRILNEDFRKRNSDTADIVPAFKNIAADTRIEFRLANKTPGGTCTNGIERIHSLTTYLGNDQSKLNYWPRDRYLNIWVVRNMAEGIAGYAYLPGSVAAPQFAPYDGIVILSSYVGSIGTGSATTARALTHEVGHYLNLLHTWGNGPLGADCGDDSVDDTPETKGWGTCKLDGSVCNPPVIENVQNYMEYSYCYRMFSEGQADRMRAVLNASTSDRNLLWQPSNLEATGTADTIEPICPPRIDFYASTRMTCVNSLVTFYDVSWNGPVDERLWTFQDGTPATSTEKNPKVSFSTSGWKTVTLTGSNAAGSSSLTRTAYIYVTQPPATLSVGYWESFDQATTFNNEYLVFNPEGNNSMWQHTYTAGNFAPGAVKLNNHKNMNGDIDVLVTPPVNLKGAGTVYLNFYTSAASNAVQAANVADELKIYVSTNCGLSWQLRQTISGVNLANAGYYSNSFTPNSASQWVARSVMIPSTYNTENVRFKFEYRTNGRGNNIYIDDIHVSNYPVGLPQETSSAWTLQVYPNPVQDHAQVLLQLTSLGYTSLTVRDLFGRVVAVVHESRLGPGQHVFDLDARQLPETGVYFLHLQHDSQHAIRRLMVH
ncbi:MAG: M43 family zinc metalloprotease [Chitinophagales bacterium]|nr:M43 family zinc metalloprotease [Chitinophagales bacterium]MDW8427921.1 M43 family zinc metalloprotease [Chitinophagales bacterium]